MEKSFAPIIGNNPKILILGTLPGKESLRLQQYYGHPRNAFWKILFSLFKEEEHNDYEEKVAFLKRNKIALWDVCMAANRKSSLDVDIKNEEPNAIISLLERHPSIRVVGFNGQKAEQLYKRYFSKREDINYHTLLSTSPANATYTFSEKLTNWKTILEA
ncbi:DNA-deoxyinosine glycosylase [Tenacibaculum amylolyticum]|uniref:DNA-deoxyinosine glycosylase n=1 Tax=Tenacibaculum amylolyticum TaxID=104269 RepID=UPI003893CEA4